jgi:soluble lytic murein transglycosylase-like protein
MGNIFGSSKVPSSTTSVQQVTLPDWANDGLSETGNRARWLMNNVPYQQFGGQRSAGVSAWTNQGAVPVDAAMRYQPRSLGQTSLQPYMDPYQREVIDASYADIDRSTQQALTRQTGNNIAAAGFGGFGDRSAVAAAEIERAGIDQKARTGSALRSQGFGRAQDMAVGDINRDMQGTQQRMQAGLALAGLGEIDRTVQQAAMDRNYEDFQAQRDDPFLKTQWAAGVINGASAPLRGGTSSSQGATAGPSVFSQGLGAATSIAGLFALSDPRDKKDKQRLGTDPETGLGIWAYRYKGDDAGPKSVGPMADEVERRYPHLVRRVGGHRIIDQAGLAELGEGAGYAVGGLAGAALPHIMDWSRDRIERAYPSRHGYPPLIEGVAEPIPMTDAYDPNPLQARPLPANYGPVGGQPDYAGIASEVRMPPAGGGQPDYLGAIEGMPEAETVNNGAPFSPQIQEALAGLRRAQVAGNAPNRNANALPDATPAALPAVAAPRPAGAAAPAASAPAAAPPAEGWSFRGALRGFADRLVDPDNAGALAMISAGAGMMASQNPSWLGAVGEGAARGVQTATQMMPMRRARQDEEQARALIQGAGLPADALSPAIEPRGGAGGGQQRPAGAPARVARLAAGPGGEALARWLPLINRAAAENRLPGDLVASMLRQESNGDPDAVSRAGARGLMQLMPDTARDLGVDPTDPAQNVAGGARYMRQMLDRYGGDETVALAAYNWGPGNVDRWRRAGADPERLPAETRDYIARVQGRRGQFGQQDVPAEGEAPAARGAAEAAPVAQEGGAAAPQGEPTMVISGRRMTRSDLITLAAAAPGNAAVQRLVQTALPVLDREVARREGEADRAQARAEAADLRRELAGRGREAQPTELARLRAERDALPAGSPDRQAYDAAIARTTGEAAGNRFTPQQMVTLRRDAFTAARQEANGLDFPTEQDRSEWINQRGQEMLREWGADALFEGARTGQQGGGPTAPMAGGEGAQRPDAQRDTGARVRPRQAAPAGFRWSADGQRLESIPGGPQDEGRMGLTESQSRSNLFGVSMERGDQILRGASVPNDATILAWRRAPEALVNLGLNSNDQQYFNAVRLFAAGILRRETGAAFSNSELLDVQSRFFPMAGDSAEVKAQKAESRRLAIEGMRAEMPGGRFRGNTPVEAPAAGGAAGAAGQRPPLDSFIRPGG